jgi:cytochrome c-type protein NapC
MAADHSPMGGRRVVVVVLAVFVFPVFFIALSSYNLQRARSVEFCGSCHEMQRHVNEMTDPTSRSLAAKHEQRKWVNKHPCYTCHTDYAMFGPIHGKWRGMRHMYAAVFGHMEEQDIALYAPYPDVNCLQCHHTARVREEEDHEDIDPDERCVDCHDNMHKVRARGDDEE